MYQSSIFSNELIQKAVYDGREQANDFLSQNVTNKEKILGEFDTAAHAATAFLENFDADKFQERENDKKPVENLKVMLVGAFEAVSFMHTLNENLDFSQKVSVHSETLSDAYYLYISQGCGVDVSRAFMQDHIEEVVKPVREPLFFPLHKLAA